MSLLDHLIVLRMSGAPCRVGPPGPQPGAGAAGRGGAQRSRLDLIRRNSADRRTATLRRRQGSGDTRHAQTLYGPTAVNVLVSSGDIRRFILDTGGTVRVVVQNPMPELMQQTAMQLDDNIDLESTLRSSIATLNKLAANPGFHFRTLQANPGYSLVIVNATRPDGYVIFESHGFKDDNISDRMHILIKRQDSQHWFSYWVARFEAMWEASQEPPTE